MHTMVTNLDRRHYVRRLIFSPVQFHDGAEMFECHKGLKERIDRDSHTLNESEIRFFRYLGTHTQYMQNQRVLNTNDSGIKLLTRSFRRLSNVHTIDIVTGPHFIGARKVNRSFKDFLRLELDASGANTLNVLFTAVREARLKVRKLGFIQEHMVCENDPCARCSAESSHDWIRRPYLFSTSFYCPSAPVMMDSPPSLIRSPCIGSILRQFKFYRNVLSSAPEDVAEVEVAIRRILGSAKSLERLEIGQIAHTGTEIGNVFRRVHLPRLKYLEFCRTDIQDGDTLGQVFTTHALRLEHVRVTEEYFTRNVDWEELLSQLRNKSFPVLRSFILQKWFEETATDAAPFINKVTAEHPLPLSDTEGDDDG